LTNGGWARLKIGLARKSGSLNAKFILLVFYLKKSIGYLEFLAPSFLKTKEFSGKH
jgi:hypothetical protein